MLKSAQKCSKGPSPVNYQIALQSWKSLFEHCRALAKPNLRPVSVLQPAVLKGGIKFDA